MKRRADGLYEQTENYVCGPVAIINALVHNGKLIGDEHEALEEIKKKCKTTQKGTKIKHLDAVSKEFFKCKKSYSLRIMKRNLDKGRPIILIYPNSNIGNVGHVVFVNSEAKVINGKHQWDFLYENLMHCSNETFAPIGWILE